MADEKASTVEILSDEVVETTDDVVPATNESTATVTETTIETTVVTDGEGNVISTTSTSETVTTEDTPPQDAETTEHVDNLQNQEITEHGDNMQNEEKPKHEVAEEEKDKTVEEEKKEEDHKKKPKKPLSPALQRLTAKKQPHDSAESGPSTEERKAKVNKMRQSKINEHRKQEDDKRAAVLERKRKLEEDERKKKDALLKKLTADTAPKKTSKQASMKRYSSSTSNLTQLKKTKPVEAKIDIGEKAEKSKLSTKPAARPSSAMSRTRPVSSSNLHTKSKDKLATDKKTSEPKKAGVATKTPATRMSLAPRPATALGVSAADRRKTLPGKTTGTTRPTSSATSPPARPIRKEVSKPIPKKEPLKPTSTDVKKTPSKTTTVSKKPATTKPATAKPKEVKKPEDVKRPISATTKKTTPTAPSKKPPTKSTTPKSTTVKSSTLTKKKPTTAKHGAVDQAAGKMTEEEAKKALSERRKKAKEEAEAKACAEREKDEQERQKREEEEKLLAEQLKEEEERQTALLGQLKVEEEERQKRMQEEKEQRERDEKERIEAEAKQRDEEIERKAKIEAERIQKEHHKKEQESEAERIERKKRVELIMARVSANRAGSASTDSPSKPIDDEAFEPESARLRVDGILKAKGLGRSTENLLDIDGGQETPTEVAEAAEPVSPAQDSNIKNEEEEKSEAISISQNIDIETTEGKLSEERQETPLEVEISTDHHTNQEVTVQVVEISSEQPSNQENSVDVEISAQENTNIEIPLVEVSETTSEQSTKDNEQAITGDSEILLDSPLIDVTNVTKGADDQPENEQLIQIQPVVDLSETNTNIRVESREISPQTDSHNDNNNISKESPVNAWPPQTLTTSTDLIVTEEKMANMKIESSELLNDVEPDTLSSEIVMKTTPIVVEQTQQLDEAAEESSPATTNPVQDVDVSDTTEKEQWTDFESRMNDMQETNPKQTEPSSEEAKLWKLAEGKVELSECF